MSTYKKGASPRQLSVRELHRELRRADLIIMTALAVMPIENHEDFEAITIEQGLTQPDDFAAMTTRHNALNRIAPSDSLTKIILITSCLILAVAWYIADFGGHYGSIN